MTERYLVIGLGATLNPRMTEEARMYRQHVALIQAPFSGGAGIPGCELAPSTLCRTGLGASLRTAGHWVRDTALELADCGCSGRATLPQLVAACQRARAAVATALTEGELPVLIGGDHSLSIGSLAAVARHCRVHRRPLWVLWFDAHADFNTFATSPSGNVHGMPAAVTCGLGDPGLLALGDVVPMIEPARLALIGVRTIDAGERELLQSTPVRLYEMTEVRRRGLAQLIEEVLHQVAAGGGHLHVSIDMDVMDPKVAPGVGSPEADGLGLIEMQQAMQSIAASGQLASLDVMELNPLQDICGVTARLAIGLIEAVLDRSATIRSVSGL